MNSFMIIVAIVFTIVVACAFAHPVYRSLRIAYLIDRATEALTHRDHDQAESCCRKLAAVIPKLRDPEQRSAIEFFTQYGFGACRAKQDDFPVAEKHFLRAADLLDQGVQQSLSVKLCILAELATMQTALGKTVESRDSIRRLKQRCERAEESDIDDIAELVTGAAAGAASRSFKDLAFEIARTAQSVLERSDAWHDGMMAHTQISLASFHMMHCEYGPARELIEKAIENAGAELELDDLDNAHFTLGNIHLLSGDLEKSRQAFERSLAIKSDQNGTEHWKTSLAGGSMVNLHRTFGDYQIALEFSDIAFNRPSIRDSQNCWSSTLPVWAGSEKPQKPANIVNEQTTFVACM